jgi:signal transduction histidine kinase
MANQERKIIIQRITALFALMSAVCIAIAAYSAVQEKNAQVFLITAAIPAGVYFILKPLLFDPVGRLAEQLKETQERMLTATEEAESDSRTKSELLTAMCYEIRTPVNGIIGMSEIALDPDLKDKHRNDIYIAINAEANSLLSVINDILNFSMLESGKTELEAIPFDLKIMMADIADSLGVRAKKKGLNIVFSLSPELPHRLTGDPGRLRQLLMNLADNALKFTHKGEIRLNGEIAQDLGKCLKIRFTIKDSGIGIPEAKQAGLFDHPGQASGLGLVISRQLAELMGGDIGAESEAGKGSSFWFTAVFGKTEPCPDYIPAKKKTDLSNLRVLVVRDDRRSRQMIPADYLKSLGCMPVEAAGGDEALSILKGSVSSGVGFHLILTDIQTGDMNSFDLARQIRAADELKKIPIIVLTSVGMSGDAKICKDIGIQGYLTGSVRHHELLRAIESVLEMARGGRDFPKLITKHSIAEDCRSLQPKSGCHRAPMDFQTALVEFDGDKAFLKEVLEGFLKNARRQIQAIKQAVSSGDADTVVKESHSIKGGASLLTLNEIAEIAFELETMGKSGNLEKGSESLERFETAFHLLEAYVKELRIEN